MKTNNVQYYADMNEAKKNIPTVLVIFGATGDLMTKKITPALYNLFLKGKLPKMFRVIGFARRDLTREAFQKHVTQILETNDTFKIQKKLTEEFLNYFYYHQGHFDSISDYNKLATDLGKIDGEWKVCSNKLFYTAVPPQYYETIFRNLHDSGLTIPCGPDEGWTRVLVEKPFGNDFKTAEKLDLLLAKLFKEEQIYRIDHYLAKEMLQNILMFRFSNHLLEPSWNNKYIEKVEIKLYEKIGVENRGFFYDGLGALRDVGQNHLLQMLALITMNKPVQIDADSVRKNRSEMLKTLRPPSAYEIKHHTFRAQYEGYRKITGVEINSKKETYFKIRAFLDHPRWRTVPIYMESGKRFSKALKEIVVTFRPSLRSKNPDKFKNQVIFTLEPHEEIRIEFISKKPGLEAEIEKRSLDFLYRKREQTAQYVEEYEKLLIDAVEGNQLLFLSTEEIQAMWKYVDPIIHAWDSNAVPLKTYKPDTDEVLNITKANIEMDKEKIMKKEVGVIGLGKMGSNVARQLLDKNWKVVGYNRSPEKTRELEKEGMSPAYSFKKIAESLKSPRVIWLMLPAGTGQIVNGVLDVLLPEYKNKKKVIDQVLDELLPYLSKGDVLIDAGNSFYKDTIERSQRLKKKNIHFFDVGFSGGPAGARYGGSLMVGGKKQLFEYSLPLLTDLALVEGVMFFEGIGAGHFVKMVHNGIEYGMMQSIAEGFTILKKSKFKLDLTDAIRIYNNGSVIESKLTNWLLKSLEIYGNDLEELSGKVGRLGEGDWTVETAKSMNVKATVIEKALSFRIESQKKPNFTGKVLSALRNQFGGHEA